MSLDYKEIKDIFEKEYDRDDWSTLLKDVFPRYKDEDGKEKGVGLYRAPVPVNNVDRTLAEEAICLGDIILSKNEKIAVYEVALKKNVDVSRNRRGIRDMLNKDWGKKENKGYAGAFIVSYPKGDRSVWRFSFVEKKDGDKETTATYLLGKGQECHTAAERFEKLRNSKKTLLDVVEAFSVGALTKEFYKEIEDWFKWAKDKVEFPGHKYLEISKEEHQAKMTLRLITRLIFIWFLKEKGLVPKELFDEAKIDELLNRKKFSALSPYYRAILQNLFFATLNTPIDKREWLKVYECRGINPKRGEQEYFRYWDFFKEEERKTFFISKERLSEEERKKSFEGKKELNRCGKIPFVNGGLFENLDGPDPDDDNQRVDCFSDRKSNLKPERLKVPDELFFGEKDEGEEERKGKKKGKKKKERKGIIDILKRYNFTLEENTSDDEEVALDPELLGCVFENLLAFVNPETSKPARNASGSFYTPREIVDYMVSESLKAYLSTKVGDGECLEALFATKPSEEAKYKDNGKFKDAVAKALDEVKILDPACGSGAFPMGMLSKMIQILEKIGKIDPSNPRQIYKKKLQIIQDCIYGVDIQDIAVQISKLRFFISLLCDQVKDDKKDNYGIEALPNLETKIVCADTLKKLPKSEYDALLEEDKKITELKDKLFEKRKKYFNEKGKTKKRELREEDKAKREELEKIIKEFVENNTIGLISKKKSELAQCEEDLKLLKKKAEYEEIAAVPAQQEFRLEDSESKKTQKKKNKIDIKKKEKELEQLEQEISKLTELKEAINGDGSKEEGQDAVPPIIKAAKLIAGWDPYNPSKREKFFSPEWMFGVPEGFDIVIGNPPYIRLEKDTKTQYEKEEYKTAGDIYCLFYERGWQLLKNGGHLCFITSNKWTCNDYGEKLREFFTRNTNPKLFIDFGGLKIFKSAAVDTNILMFSKSNNEHATKCAVVNNQNKDRVVDNLSVFVGAEHTIQVFYDNEAWVALLREHQELKKKIEAEGTPLKDWGVKTNRGILTGCNDAFHISTEKRNEILGNCKDKDECERTDLLIKRFLEGKDIKRYTYKWDDKWLINTHNGLKDKKNYKPPINIDDYPAVKSHLDQYWKKIEERQDQGDTPYNLRGCKYLEDFKEEKIIYGQFQDSVEFAFAKDEIYLSSNEYFIICDKYPIKCLLGFLNSKVMGWLLGKLTGSLSGNSKIAQKSAFERLSVPIPKDDTTEKFKELEELVEKRLKGEASDSDIDRFIYNFYDLTSDEIKIIESQTS